MNLTARLKNLLLPAAVLGAALPAHADEMGVFLENKGLMRASAAPQDDDELANLVKTRAARPAAVAAVRPAAGKTAQQMASMDDFVQQQILRLPKPVVAMPSNHSESLGNFMVPVSGARKSSDYGYRRHPVLKKVRLHSGIDYAAPSGTPIYAAESGVVELAGWKGAYGKTVIIKHNDRYSTLYGHASKYVVSAGQKVQRGQLIAYVGSTGRSTGPHLHFEVLDGSKRVNPNKYLSQVF
ncbi:M23 family metallopeptidase [Bergeriella denitrificans]|uniref:Peptidase n=1 Tax=Bergeriella denitrificans TaxID=494 RepID=A0A378UFB0_BERDE|nr:M23 family metallopeptidase [Bergeriella denitrificans]STZ75985.1 peptidase [Bergeriella denitrificans]